MGPFSGSTSAPHTMASVNPSAFDDDNDEEETILELDYSDTRALSDLQVFENKERALREQILERKVASRNASRSTTPSVASHLETISAKAKISLNGINGTSDKKQTPAALVSYTALQSSPSRETADPVETIRPATPRQNTQKSQVPVIPPTQATASTVDEKSLSPTKKKTRRGRGKQKDKEKEGSSGLDTYEHSAIGEADAPSGEMFKEGQNNGELLERIKPSTSIENVSSEIDTTNLKPSSEVCLKIKDCLHFTLSGKISNVASKQGLVELAVRLLQTDNAFVDDLWNAWEESVGSVATKTLSHETHIDAFVPFSAATSVTSAMSTVSLLPPETVPDKRPQSPEARFLQPPLIFSQSAPAMLPTLSDIAHTDSPDLASTPSNTISSLSPTADNSLIPPMVRDVVFLEDEKILAGASMDEELEEGSPQEGGLDFAEEEESHVVDSML